MMGGMVGLGKDSRMELTVGVVVFIVGFGIWAAIRHCRVGELLIQWGIGGYYSIRLSNCNTASILQ